VGWHSTRGIIGRCVGRKGGGGENLVRDSLRERKGGGLEVDAGAGDG
jgi:hypothetical protein